MAVIKDVKSMRYQLDQRMQNRSRPLVYAQDEPGQCPVCGGEMLVQKSCAVRTVDTIENGTFDVRETVHVCKRGCRFPSGPLVTERSSTLADLVLHGRGVGYDVMVFIGRQRFQEHRQREEIQQTLSAEPYRIHLSTGEISILAQLFLEYLERLHYSRAEPLRAALASDGGWPLHIDATGEDGRGTLFVAIAGWRKWVLGAWNIPTEHTDHILPHLRSVVKTFGAPLAIVRDLGRAVTAAADALLEELDHPIPILACHQHFLSDVGKDLLDEHHNSLRKLFRHFNIRQGVRTLARDLGRKIGTDIDQARDNLLDWLASDLSDYSLPSGRRGLAIVRSMAQWVLDFHADGQGHGFPYDRPYLDLYERCRLVLRTADAFLRIPPKDTKVRSSLRRLARLLAPVLDDDDFLHLSRKLRTRVKCFEELRAALRLTPKTSSSNTTQTPKDAALELNDVHTAVDKLVASLQERRPSRGPAVDTREAIDIILEHIERHYDYLWGHALSISLAQGEAVRVVDRTNNIPENFFRALKQPERRRSGRKNLARDFELLLPAAGLVPNLDRPDYVSILCGSLDDLPHAFASLDARDRLQAQFDPTHPRSSPLPPPLSTASFPPEDRKIIRLDSMRLRILTAANSRAPRASLNPH
jgi:hypothetical protein